MKTWLHTQIALNCRESDGKPEENHTCMGSRPNLRVLAVMTAFLRLLASLLLSFMIHKITTFEFRTSGWIITK